MNTYYMTIVFAVAVVLGLCSIVCLLKQTRTRVNLYAAISFFILSLILLYFWIIDTGLIRFLPIFVYSDIWLTFFIAPSMHLTFVTMIRETKTFESRPVRHFIIPFFVTAAFFIYNIVNYSRIPTLLISNFDHYRTFLILSLSILSDSYLIFYILLTLFSGWKLWKEQKITRIKEFTIIMCLLLFLLLLSICFIISYTLENESFLMIITSAIGLLAIVYFLISIRIPKYSQGLLKTKRILLHADERDHYLALLSRLMENDTVFRNPELTLQALAGKMHISPNELSQLINESIGMNFRAYINRYRLENIQKELILFPDRNILDIAFENGFNSKSAFNTIFLEKTGISPREYRKQAQLKNIPL